MAALSKHALIVAASSYIAVILALFVALRLDLQNPWWAMASVYFAQPTQQRLTGAVWAKSAYRVAGTLIGGIVCIAIVPSLSNSAVLLLLGVGLWLGLCAFGALFDRSPRSYLFMLAGYTVVLVGLPAAFNPAAIFDTTVARVEEITIGVLSLAVVQSLLFPLSVANVAIGKLDGVMADARSWIVQGLSTLQPGSPQSGLVTDLAAINALATDWRFEGTFSSRRRRALWALEERLVTLIPTITSVEDRISALSQAGKAAPEAPALAARVGAWVQDARPLDMELARAIAEDIAASAPVLSPASNWTDMLRASLANRLAELVTLWAECLLLALEVKDPHGPAHPAIHRLIASSRPRALHVDAGVAALSAFATVATLLLLGAFTIATRWESGPLTMGVATVACVLFSTADDPTPMARDFSVGLVAILPVLILYEFAVLPALDGFPLLALSLLPVIVPLSMAFTYPKHMFKALGMLAGFSAGLALQPRFQSDLPSLLNVYLAVAMGPFAAAVCVSLVRIIPTEHAAARLLRAGWRDLAGLLRARSDPGRTVWASRMVDRVGLLIPRLLQLRRGDDVEISHFLRDARLAQAVVVVKQLRASAEAPIAAEIDLAITALAMHFERAAAGRPPAPRDDILIRLDAAIAAVLHLDHQADRHTGVSAMLGLRRGMFPEVMTYPWAGARRMISEINIDGVFFSGALATACIAAVTLVFTRWVLLRAGFYKLVWHRHLVDLALFAILWAGVALVTNQLTTTGGT